MAQTESSAAPVAPGAAFAERFVEVDGFRIRYLEAGTGEPLVCFHASGGPRLSHGHELLAEERRVVLFETPGAGASRPSTSDQRMWRAARTMATAVASLGIERYNLWGTSFGGRCSPPGWPCSTPSDWTPSSS